MDIGKIKSTIDNVGRKANIAVDGFAAFHNFEQYQVWLGIIVVLVLVVLLAIII